MSTVQLLEIKGTELRVKGLDVINGTHILDIKPYTPQYDVPVGEVGVPRWVDLLEY